MTGECERATGERGELRGCSVVGRERLDGDLPATDQLGDLLPGARMRVASALREVTDHGPGGERSAADDRAPLHGREVLRLVHDDVREVRVPAVLDVRGRRALILTSRDGRLRVPKERIELVEQRHVLDGPPLRLTPCPVQHVRVVRRQQIADRVLQSTRSPRVHRQDLGRVERRPEVVQQHPDLRRLQHEVAELLLTRIRARGRTVRALRLPGGAQRRDQLVGDRDGPRVVPGHGARSVDARERALADRPEARPAELGADASDREADRFGEGRQCRCEQPPADLHHPRVALDVGDLRTVPTLDADACRAERLERSLDDAVLAERRQDASRVVGERSGRADDEHPAVLVALAVAVEEEGDPVERDHGLARSRSAGDDERAGRRRSDDPVLIGLDRRDDVAHAFAVRSLQRSEERPLARRRFEPELLRGARIDELVHDVDDARAVREDGAASRDAFRLRGRRAVERRSGRRAPVDEQHVVVIDHRHPADRKALPV